MTPKQADKLIATWQGYSDEGIKYTTDPDEHTSTYVVREATADKLIDAVRECDHAALVHSVNVHIQTKEG